MRDLNEHTITDEVLARISGAKDPRFKHINEALVRHLHAFLREIEPTQAEWEAGIDFLTRVGRMCTEKRQEFILMSDVLGASMLVDAMNNRVFLGATETTVFGPFFVEARHSFPLGADISAGVAGTPMIVTGSVSDVDGRPIARAVIDTWHSDNEGYYDVQTRDELSMRGSFETGENGRFWFWSIRPTFYPIPHDGPVGEMLRAQGRHPYRPEHVHFMIAAPAFQTLITHVFAAGDPYIDSDAVFGVKNSLIRTFEKCEPGVAPDGSKVDRHYVHFNYDFVLQRAVAGA